MHSFHIYVLNYIGFLLLNFSCKLWKARRKEVLHVYNDCVSDTLFHSEEILCSEISFSNYIPPFEKSLNDNIEFESFNHKDSQDSVGCESSEDLSDAKKQNKYDVLCSKIRKWTLRNNCSQKCTNEILGIFLEYQHHVPKDCRTLLQFKRDIPTLQFNGGGEYIHFGLRDQTTKQISMHSISEDVILLTFNIDGMPLFKSSSYQIWPILARIHGYTPFIIGIFGGTCKPTPHILLKNLVDEFKILCITPLTYLGKNYHIKIHAFVCDAPARVMLKGIVNHTGCHSCERCTKVGKSVLNRVVYGYVDDGLTILRSNVDFCNNKYFQKDVNGRSHQREKSVLREISVINFISMFPLDYMHLVCLGVTRRILYFLKGNINGTKHGKLSCTMINQISDKLLQLNGKLPSNFSRQPRGLFELDRWKATELRSFLLYTGMIVLKGIISVPMYKHFIRFAIAIRILCDNDKDYRNSNLDNACKLLKYFVVNSNEHFGELFCVYNVHNLLHICDDVQFYNTPLDDVSAFEFENYLQQLKRLVRSKHNPIVQICKRFNEMNNFMMLSSTS